MKSSLKRKTITHSTLGKIEISELSARGHIALAAARNRGMQSDLFAVAAQHCVSGWEDEALEDILGAHSLATLTELSEAIFTLSDLDDDPKKT